MASRGELRSFGFNLAAGIDTLFLGSAAFIYVFRRMEADAWKAGWADAPDARVPFFVGVALIAAIPWVYGTGRERLAALLGLGGAAGLIWASREARTSRPRDC